MEKPPVLLRFGPLLFYPIAFVLWALASLGLLAGVDVRKLLGLFAVVVWPIYGLFIVGSVIAHILFLIQNHYRFILPLLLLNVLGIIGYWILVIIVLQFAMYP